MALHAGRMEGYGIQQCDTFAQAHTSSGGTPDSHLHTQAPPNNPSHQQPERYNVFDCLPAQPSAELMHGVGAPPADGYGVQTDSPMQDGGEDWQEEYDRQCQRSRDLAVKLERIMAQALKVNADTASLQAAVAAVKKAHSDAGAARGVAAGASGRDRSKVREQAMARHEAAAAAASNPGPSTSAAEGDVGSAGPGQPSGGRKAQVEAVADMALSANQGQPTVALMGLLNLTLKRKSRREKNAITALQYAANMLRQTNAVPPPEAVAAAAAGTAPLLPPHQQYSQQHPQRVHNVTHQDASPRAVSGGGCNAMSGGMAPPPPPQQQQEQQQRQQQYQQQQHQHQQYHPPAYHDSLPRALSYEAMSSGSGMAAQLQPPQEMLLPPTLGSSNYAALTQGLTAPAQAIRGGGAGAGEGCGMPHDGNYPRQLYIPPGAF